MMIYKREDGTYPTYTGLGCYPIYYIADDSDAICANCANTQAEIHEDLPDDGWRIIASDVNYDDPDLFCAHCNTRIESAYAEEGTMVQKS